MSDFWAVEGGDGIIKTSTSLGGFPVEAIFADEDLAKGFAAKLDEHYPGLKAQVVRLVVKRAFAKGYKPGGGLPWVDVG